MSFLKQLFDQINTRDGGKTFNNPTGNSGARAGTPPSVMPSAVQASQFSDFFNRPRGATRQPMPYRQAQPMQPFIHQGAEDDGLVNGPQGLHPMNADVGHMRGLQQPYMDNNNFNINPQTTRFGGFEQPAYSDYDTELQPSVGQNFYDGKRTRNYLNF